MDTVKYERIPFYVDVPDAVSAENIEAMAEWCDGEIRTEGNGPNARQYISVKVHMPLKERQTKAFFGDRILFAGNGFKVYTPKAFAKSFRKVKQLSKAEANRAGIRPPIEGQPKKKGSGIPQNMRPKVQVQQKGTDNIATVPADEIAEGSILADSISSRTIGDDESNSFSDLSRTPEKSVQDQQAEFAAEQQEAYAQDAERILAEIENGNKDES